MRSEVIVQLDPGQEFRINLEALTPMTQEAARRWLDEQFVALECEPLRATGKLLTADRVLCVAQAGGAQRLAETEWAQTFARAASASLGKSTVRIDVTGMTVTY
jgi:hypothetical protein